MNRKRTISFILIALIMVSAVMITMHKRAFETIKHYTLYDGTKVTMILRWDNDGNLIYTIRDYKGKISYKEKTPFKTSIIVNKDGTEYLRQEADFEKSQGKIDARGIRYVIYSKNKEINYAERDTNNDGKIDEFLYFKDNMVSKVDRATKKDGKIDVWQYFENGNIVRAEYDTDRNGQVDLWQYYKDGKPIRSEYDSDDDGKPDKEGVPPIYDKYKITYKMGGAR